MRFPRYTSGSMASMSLSDLLLQAHRTGMLHARAENSGCEGCYCEVAVWNDATVRWERLAFHKEFDGDQHTAYDRAEVLAWWINEYSRCRDVDWVHSLPNAA